ncbi:MAG: tRNA uridine-5-carboxymethylaminomethyl(34) synthesis GTPase MnmE [Paludibacteraceae bacterium]|nr:tRNA uridine-5-carboxymethylaminomethyl(34) synthesis GTPase MnmE [Paludibacteraceae bacterium]
MAVSVICAISTPHGTGGIAVVRISGSGAVALAERLVGGRPLDRQLCFRRIDDLDDVVVSVFRAPHSYTGEDVVEISCHGSVYIQEELLRRLIDLGARLAEPGEFTRRAFVNGRMDLAQAEAVADLIAAQTRGEKDVALSQMRGSVSSELEHLREQLLTFTSLLELELDFADHEDLVFAERTAMSGLVHEVAQRIDALIDSFSTGQALRRGVQVAIVGAANAGKSTLLNALLGDERAIVSDIPGTTRDTVEDTLVIGGVLFRLIDTAGLRQTEDPVEQMGMQRSRKAVDKADIVVRVIDASAGEADGCCPADGGKHVVTVYNKADLLAPEDKRQEGGLYLSAKSGDVAALRDELLNHARLLLARQENCGTVVSSVRHYEALKTARQALENVMRGMDAGLGSELLAVDLHDCLDALGSVTGRITSDEVLGNIFSKFCIGK